MQQSRLVDYTEHNIFDVRGGVNIDRVEHLPYGELVTLRSGRHPVEPTASNAPARRRKSRCQSMIVLVAVGILFAAKIAAAPATERDAAISSLDTQPSSQIIHHEPTPYIHNDLVYFATDAQDVVPLQAGVVNDSPVDAVNAYDEESSIPAYANMIADCTVTYYCTELYPHICGTGDGITASGRPVEAGVSVAVDPSIIPLGSTVVIDYGDGELHYYRADDIGGSIDGNHIDVAVDTHNDALALGVNTATVWWYEP